MNNRHAMLSKVHLAIKDLRVDDGTYRDMLHALYGVTSAKDLTDKQLDDLLRHLISRGWQAKPKRASAAAPTGKAPLLYKIEMMLKELNKPSAYADGIARNMFKVDKVDWCDVAQLRKIVAALVYQQQREVRYGLR